MRKTLIINSGSSSLKYKLYSMPEYHVDCEGIVDRIGIKNGEIVLKFDDDKKQISQNFSNHEQAIDALLKILEENHLIANKNEITKVGHRVVQGGEIFKESTLIEDKELIQIYELAKLAPLHNKANGDGIKIFKKLLPHAINVAVFDTEYHQSMPKKSYLYPVPYEWYQNYKVRRYGMHGTSHKYIFNTISEIENNEKLKLINCHLGNGASLCAIDSGKVIQTSMGLTPLAGIMMGTRSGDIDPSIINYISEQADLDLATISDILNKESGMLGLSQVSSDFRDIEQAINDGNQQAITAMNVYLTRIVETIGSYYVRLGGVDVISFTGGVGENDANVRAEVLMRLQVLGIKVNQKINDDRSLNPTRVITNDDSKVKAYVITTDEEYQIAFEAERF